MLTRSAANRGGIAAALVYVLAFAINACGEDAPSTGDDSARAGMSSSGGDNGAGGHEPPNAGSGGSGLSDPSGSGAPAGGAAPQAGVGGESTATGGRSDGGESGDAGAGASGGGTEEPTLPCDVEAIIVANCQRCHQDPPREFAPFPIVTWQDTRFDYSNRLVYERMLPAVRSGYMPPVAFGLTPPVEPLSDAEKATLVGWLEAGAPPSMERCD